MADRRRIEPVVRLTRIYTRHGDAGETHLGDMSRVSKTHPRVAAYGDVDELNACIGVAVAGGVPPPQLEWLRRIQNDLFDVGADLAVPPAEETRSRLRVTAEQVAVLEGWCDEVNDRLPNLTSFVLPGGSPRAAALHQARAVCRRAERSVVALAESDEVSPWALAYLNRLSDLLFILARDANAGGANDVLWVPGGPPAAG